MEQRTNGHGGTIPIMSGSPTPVPSFGAPRGGEDGSRLPLIPIAIGVLTVVVVIGLFIFFGRRDSTETAASGAADPYSSSLTISDVAMSTAANFAGQEVTYIEGKITNHGDKTVSNILLQLVFHDQLGQIAQREQGLRMMVITTREPYIDTSPLSNAPLRPGQTKEFRQTFEHVSADWNMQLPEITIVRAVTD